MQALLFILRAFLPSTASPDHHNSLRSRHPGRAQRIHGSRGEGGRGDSLKYSRGPCISSSLLKARVMDVKCNSDDKNDDDALLVYGRPPQH